MQNTLKKFGFLSALAGLILFLTPLIFENLLSFGLLEVLGYLTMAISVSFVFFGIMHYRDKENGGQVTFGKALLVGILISLCAGIGVGIADYIYTTVINPDFFEQYAEKTGSEEVLEMGSFAAAALMLATVFMMGFVVSLVSALILQRKK